MSVNENFESNGFERSSQCPHPLRYLGLAHCCGYIGLTPVYSHENLLEHFIQEFELLEDDPVEHKILAECSTQTGAKVYLRFVSFALSTMGNAVEDGLISDFMSVEVCDRILKVRAGLGTMYSYHFQMHKRWPNLAMLRRIKAAR